MLVETIIKEVERSRRAGDGMACSTIRNFVIMRISGIGIVLVTDEGRIQIVLAGGKKTSTVYRRLVEYDEGRITYYRYIAI